MTYRIFEIANVNRIPNYDQYGGLEWFGSTRRLGSSLIGEYDVNGPSDTNDLPEYTGEWPIPPLPAYDTWMYPDELMAQLTDEEYIEAPERLKTELLAAAGRKVDVSNVRIVTGLSSFLTAERTSELIKGVVQ